LWFEKAQDVAYSPIKCFEQDEAKGLITVDPQTSRTWELTDEGNLVAEKGSYEFHVFTAIPKDKGIPQDEL
ncbi:unnamed protein product, partial [Timema podura]|nr:unnamed protein product [Timema podura]